MGSDGEAGPQARDYRGGPVAPALTSGQWGDSTPAGVLVFLAGNGLRGALGAALSRGGGARGCQTSRGVCSGHASVAVPPGMNGRQWVAGIVVLVTLAVMLWLFNRMRREG